MPPAPTNLDFKESDDLPVSAARPAAADSLLPNSGYLVRSSLSGLCFEIEDPDTEMPLVTFDFRSG